RPGPPPPRHTSHRPSAPNDGVMLALTGMPAAGGMRLMSGGFSKPATPHTFCHQDAGWSAMLSGGFYSGCRLSIAAAEGAVVFIDRQSILPREMRGSRRLEGD